MMNNSDGWYYPSQYKVENNQILLDYLTEERNADENREKTIFAAHKAVTRFSKIIEHQYEEVSHVVLFNYIGLSMLCQTDTWESELANANRLLPYLDELYQYYLHDLNYAKCLAEGGCCKCKRILRDTKNHWIHHSFVTIE